MDKTQIQVELAYATPEEQVILTLSVTIGTTLGEGIEQSDIRNRFPGMTIDPEAVGIFGQKAAMDYILKRGDRIEIYRPLIADPKEVRREKAKISS